MKKLSVLFVSACILLAIISCGVAKKQNDYQSYFIDAAIKNEVDKKTKTLEGFTFNAMNLRLFENDSVIIDTYAKGKIIDDCMTMTTLDGDTVTIIGFFGMTGALGYRIEFKNNNCTMRYFVKTDAEIYKYKKTDKLDFGISVPCTSAKLTLVSQPEFRSGEIITGIIELTSDDYYEVKDGIEKKLKIQLTGYFKTDPLATAGEQYEILKRKMEKHK